MTDCIITNASIITPQETYHNSWLRCADGKIVAIGTGDAPIAETYDANGAYLLAGFIDVHVHGAVGHDVMDATFEGLQNMGRFFAQHGVTSFLPTTLTAPHEDTLLALNTIKQAMTIAYDGANILGAHLEGPYLNPTKCGAQDRQYIRRADAQEVIDLLAVDVICLASIAPEYAENLAAITNFIERGVTVSAAHTNASYEQMIVGLERGITHSTHTYNAMPALHHRDPGAMAALLLADTVRCELIADMVHVHPAMMRLLYRIKGAEKLILVSDSMRATGMKDGTYTLGQHQVQVADGKATLNDGTLAGSILTMDVALRNLLNITGESLQTLWRTSSLNAAQALNLKDKGSIEIGKDADFVIVDEQVNVKATFIAGQLVYES